MKKRKKIKRYIFLTEDYLHYFFDGRKCVEIGTLSKGFRNVKDLMGKKIRLIAEIIS